MKHPIKNVSSSVKVNTCKNGHIHATVRITSGNKSRNIRKTIK